jgi:predicted secreted acid phosphatase
VLEDQIEHHYGPATAAYPVVGTVTISSSTSNYAKQMKQIVAGAEAYLAAAVHRHYGAGKPAVVFDIDDTLLNTYDYEIAEQFGYTPASNAVWINVGRPQSQAAATIKDLTSAGYAAPQPGRLFLKPSTPPSHLHCVSRRPARRSSASPAPASTSPAWATRRRRLRRPVQRSARR